MSQVENNRIVLSGMVIGGLGTLLLFVTLYILVPQYVSEMELVDRIKLGIECLVFPATFFLFTVIRVGSQRFGNPSDNPVKVLANSESMEVNLRVLSNTHEQVVLFALNTLALSVFLPYKYLSLLPIYSFVFVAGRVIFWAAYKHNALWRGPGFAMGILPAVLGLSYCCIVLFVRIFSNT
jgi:hypothetical protein